MPDLVAPCEPRPGVWAEWPAVSRFTTMRSSLLPLLLLLPLSASAADAPAAPLFTDQEWSGSERARPAAAHASPGAAVLQLAAALGLVLAIAGGAGWAIKRAGLRRFATGGRGRHLQVIET